jgi:hypothetical protein
MMNIVGDARRLFMFTSIRNLDGDIWDDVGSEIAQSPLILMLAHKYLLNVLYELE